MTEYNFKFKLDANVPRFDLDFTAGYIGAIKVLGIPTAANPTQDQINTAVASYITDHPGTLAGLTDDVKAALLQIAEKVVYVDDQGPDYYQDLYDALYAVTSISLNKSSVALGTIGATEQLTATTIPASAEVTWSSSDTSVATVSDSGLVTSVSYGTATITASAGSLSASCSVLIAQATVTSISAVYTQSGTVYDTDSLDSLKTDLVVTATYSDSSSATVPSADYTLSGSLTAGTSTITVSYGGKTTTFTVTVTGLTLLHNWDYTQSLVDTVGGVESELTNITRSSSGLVFSASNQHVVVGRDIMAYERTIEVDFTDALYSAGNYTAVLWHLWNGTDVTPSGTYSTFGSRYASGSTDRHIGCITTATGNWAYSTATKTFIDGLTGTLAMTVSSTGRFKFYLNGVDLEVKKNGNDSYIDSANKIKAMTLGGHGNGSYISFYNWTVKAVRIYDGVKY